MYKFAKDHSEWGEDTQCAWHARQWSRTTKKSGMTIRNLHWNETAKFDEKKSWATFCRRLTQSKNCQVLQSWSRTVIFNFCNKIVVFDTQSDSIQFEFLIIQFISQGTIDTGRMGKVPKKYLKNVHYRLKKGLLIKNGKYRFKIWFIHSFHD